MSEKVKGIVKLSEERYWEMYNAGTLDPYKQYETPQDPTYSQKEIDKRLKEKANVDYVEGIKQNLQDQITTATGGEFSKVLVGGVYQPSFDADTKANASDLQATNTQVSSLDETLDSLVSQITDEIADRKNADTNINNALSTKVDKTEIDAINNKIPAQASATNPLTDRDFVNSSISTATATFRGTVDSVDSLPTTGVDINDYAFVRATDSAGNTLYQRYKYNGSQWAFEYELNNSSFIAAQWATINSGLTKDYVDSADLNTISAVIAEVENLLKDKADKAEIPDTNLFVKKTGDTMTGPIGVNAEHEKYDVIKSFYAEYPEGSFHALTKVNIDGIKVSEKPTTVSGNIYWSAFSGYEKSFSGTLPLTVSVGTVEDYGIFSLEIRDITEDGVLEVYPTNEQSSGNIQEGGPLGLNITINQTFEEISDITTKRVSADTISAKKVLIQNETPSSNSEATRKDYVDNIIKPLKTKLDDMPYYIVDLILTGGGGCIRLARTPTEKFGYQIVWGKDEQSTNNKEYTKNFPQAFSYTPALVTGAYSRNGQQAGKTWEHSMFYDLTNTGFTWYRCDSFDITFIAIGPWTE